MQQIAMVYDTVRYTSSTPDLNSPNGFCFWQSRSSPQTYHFQIVTRYFKVRYLVYYQFTFVNCQYTRYRTSKYLVNMRKWYICGEEQLCKKKKSVWGV